MRQYQGIPIKEKWTVRLFKEDLKMENNKTQVTYENQIEPAKVVKNKGCNVCNAAAACVISPTPDFEFVGITNIFGMFG